MSLQSKLAKKAEAMGNSSSEFTAAAQKHADATWFYLIVAGILWYFLGWRWALIPVAFGIYKIFQSIIATLVAMRLENTEKNHEETDSEFMRIVQAYRNILETSVPGMVADVSKLPYTKQQIKDAIVAAIRISEDSQMKEYLKVGYIQLSNWQVGVGESNQGFDVSAMNMNQDPETLANTVIEKLEGAEAWNTFVQKEQEALNKELQAIGLHK